VDYQNVRWFNLSDPWVLGKYRKPSIRLWNCFNRHTRDGDHFWGIGVLQMGARHLLYMGFDQVAMGFVTIWRWGR
jgi:hypothetical protein